MKYLLPNSLLIVILVYLWSCHTSKTNLNNFKTIENGQYPTILPLPTSLHHFSFYKVIDPQNKKVYPAQKWNQQGVIFLDEEKLTRPTDHLKIEGSNSPFFNNAITIKQSTKELIVTSNKKPVFHYQIEEQLPAGKEEHYRRGGFIHPLYSPKGKIISDGFPEGHTHQHGIFFAFVNTQYKGEKLDFWNQHQKTGDIKPIQVGNLIEGPVFGKIATTHSHNSLKHGPILTENWEIIIYNSKPYRIDLHTTLKSVASDTLFVQDYHYGGMAFRGSNVWNKVDSLHFQNEPNFFTYEGKNRVEANHSRPLWSAMNGLIDGQKAGVALFGHSTNFQYPEPVRIHPSMPYFCLAPMVGQPINIAPGGTFEATYSFIVFDGEVPEKQLNDLAGFLSFDGKR